MIKKIKSIIIALLLILPMAFVFTGCNNNDDANNSNNNNQQVVSPESPKPVEGTYNIKLDYALPGKLAELFESVDETKSTKTSFVLPTFTGTNLNNYFEGWYNKSDDSKIDKSWVLGTSGQTISIYGKWDSEITNSYYSEGVEFAVSSDLTSVSISGYSGNSDTVILPKTFNYDSSELLVTEILEYAFEDSLINKVICLGDEISIANNAFKNSSISEFDFSVVNNVGDNAFLSTNITSINFSNRLKQLGNNAFQNCLKLNTVNFANCSAEIETISEYAFANCTKLSSLEISDFIKTIGVSAFKNCTSLINLDLSKTNIENIESEAFANSGLKSLSLPESILNVNLNAFSGLSNLEDVTLGNLFYENNQTMRGVFGTSLNYIKSITLIGSKIIILKANYFSECLGLESFRMNDSITTIEQNVFKNCTNLLNIAFSDGILGEKFDSNAFFDTAWYKTNEQIVVKNNAVLIVPLGCPSVLEASDFDNATTISMNAFSRNTFLTSVTLPATIEVIGDRAFYNCLNLQDVIFDTGSMLSKIGAEAFFNCQSLVNINLGDCINLVEIKSRAFSKIGKINNFNIPSSLSKLGIACFENSKISSFNVVEENVKYYTEDGVLYEKLKSGAAIYAYPIGSQDTMFLIQSNVKKIYESAFFANTLDYVYIASTSLTFEGNMESGVFDNSSVKIILPSSSIVIPSDNWNVYHLLTSGYNYISDSNTIELTTTTLDKNGYFVKVEIDSVDHYYLLQLNRGTLTYQTEITDIINQFIG